MISLVLLFSSAVPAGSSVMNSAIELVVKTRSDQGVVVCALFDDGSKWLKEARRTATVAIEGGVARCRFEGEAAGTYAIVAFHDDNENGRLDLLLGIPKEGYAASNEAHRKVIGEPRFEDARFVFGGGRLRLRSRMTYFVPSAASPALEEKYGGPGDDFLARR